MLGQCYPNGEAPAHRPGGRARRRPAGRIPGLQIDRRCGSGLQAVIDGCHAGPDRAADLVIAGGAESMSQVEYYSTEAALGRRGRAARCSRTAWTAAARDRRAATTTRCPAGCSRRPRTCAASTGSRARSRTSWRCARTSARSPPRARRLRGGDRPGRPSRSAERRPVIDRDEHPRADATLETLAGLRPVMARQDPEATVTAGNASGQNDGAAVCIVTHPETRGRARPRAAGPARELGRRRGPARDDGHRPGARDAPRRWRGPG